MGDSTSLTVHGMALVELIAMVKLLEIPEITGGVLNTVKFRLVLMVPPQASVTVKVTMVEPS